MTSVQITEAEVAAALEVARELARHGIPVFVAPPDASAAAGFRLPTGWQNLPADPDVVDQWRPGMALCAVMGRGVDLIDVDPRSGGDPAALDGMTPISYGAAFTPSGGLHSFVAPLGVGGRDGVFPGIDVKAGAPDGTGRGFAFLAPTVKPSKVTGEPEPYRWASPIDFDGLRRAWAQGDGSGAALAARIRELRNQTAGSRKLDAAPSWWRDFLTSSEPQSEVAAARAIQDKLAEVRGWSATSTEGFRTVLMRAAMTLGGYVGGGWLDEDDARARLEDAAAAVWGAPDDDDRRWITQGLGDGETMPFRVYTAAQEAEFGELAAQRNLEGEEPPPAAATDMTAAMAPPPPNVAHILAAQGPFDPAGDNSDQGLAQAAAAYAFPVLRYASDLGFWVKREGDVWREYKDDLSGWILGVLADLMPPGESPVPKNVEDRSPEHWQAWRRQQFRASAGTGKIATKLKAIVRADHPASLRVGELDTNPEVLWAGGVAWDLRASADVPTPAGWVHPNTPHLRTAMCAPNPTVPTPRWDAFVAAVLPDPEVRAWALRVLSIALTGYPDAALPVLYGRERSGKSSLVEMLMQLLGSYGHPASPKLLTSGGAEGASGDAMVYDLKGRRLSFIDEGPRRGHDATERLKQLTGGASLTAAPKYGGPVTFAPTHTLVLTTNAEPHLTDPALRSRLRLIPCDEPETAVRPARLPLLGVGLRAEAPGILAALMREAAAFLRNRDSASNDAAPAVVRERVGDIAAEQDPVREWLNACTAPEGWTKSSDLRRHFAEWHQSHPEYRRQSVPAPQAFGRALDDLGVPRERRRDGSYWQRSVIGGGFAGPTAPPPTASSFLGGLTTPNANTVTPNDNGVADTPPGDSPVAGGPTASATPQNPWSSPLFSSSVADVAEEEREEWGERESKENIGEESVEGSRAHTSATATDDLAGSAVMDVGAGHPASPTGDGPCGSSATPSEWPQTRRPAIAPPPPPPRKVSKRETAQRADQAKTSKAEARRALAEEKRRAAVAEVGGEVHPLPAAVDRAGHVLPVSLEQASAVVRSALARTGGVLTVDVEHTGYPVGHADFALRSVQLGDEVAVAIFDPQTHADTIREHLAAAGALVAHSATADLVPLAVYGLLDYDEAWTRTYDTVLPAKLADPSSTGSDPGLKRLAPAVLGDAAVTPGADEARAALFKAGKWLTETKVDTPLERSGWAQVRTGCEVMLRYAGSDVIDTAALAKRLPAVDSRVLERERLAQRMTARVTYRGVRLDPETVAALSARHTAELAAVRAQVQAFGIENPGSDQQVGAKAVELGAQLPRTATGRPSVAAGVLEALRDAEGPLGAFVAGVLDYRHHETVLGLFLDPYRQLIERGDGRARPTIYTIGTNTGRMSCNRPNLQQLPKKGGVRACITADPGQMMISADFSSVEIRVAAALSGDPTLQRMIAEGRDLHEEIALQVWGPDPEASVKAGRPAPLKANRYKAKSIVFGRIYGGGLATLSAQVGVTQQVGQAVLDTLDALTPQLKMFSRHVSDAARAGHTQFPSYSGRIIHLPQDTPHKAVNYVVQGSARELLVDALIRWADTPWGAATLFPVHDELVAFVPAQDGAAATAALVQAMTSNLNGIPIVAEADEPSPFWTDAT